MGWLLIYMVCMIDTLFIMLGVVVGGGTVRILEWERRMCRM